MKTDFPSGDRTYYVSDERLRAFHQLTPEQKLRWIEEMAGRKSAKKYARHQHELPVRQ